MDVLLGKVTSQAMNYAIRSGITITTTYAIKQCSRLLKETPRSQAREELMQLQLRLESKIRIISPAIDMIELISARGNTSLESAVSLTKEIRYEIQRLGTRLSDAVEDEKALKSRSSKAKSRVEAERQLESIVVEIKNLLAKIEDAVPLINLAITTSGVNLSTKLSGTISPSRLLQASTFLTAADSKFAAVPGSRVQVGPSYTLSLYMLFAGHAWRPVDEEGVRETTWKEVIHKAKVKLVRVPLNGLYDSPGEKKQTLTGGIVADSIPGDGRATEYAYQLLLIEDLDDDRLHTFEEGEYPPGPCEDVANAGIRDVLPVHEISKVFYADTGKILNIGGDGEANNPVLLLRRDVHAEPPRRMMHRSQTGEGGYDDDSFIDDEHQNGVTEHRSTEITRLDARSTRNIPVPDSPRPADVPNAAWRLPINLDPEWLAFEVYNEEPDIDSDSDETPPTSRPSTRREDTPTSGLATNLSNLHLKSSSPAPNGAAITSSPPHFQHQPQIKTSLSLLEMLLKLTALQQFRQESHLAIEDELLNFFLEDSSSAGAGGDKEVRQRVRHEAVRRVGFDPYDESPIKRRGEAYLEGRRGGASPRPSFDASAFVEATGMVYLGQEGWASPTGEVQQSVEYEEELPSSPSPPMFLECGSRQLSNGSHGGTPAQQKPRLASQVSLLATPPSSSRSRQVYGWTSSEPKVRSPLSTIGTPEHGTKQVTMTNKDEELRTLKEHLQITPKTANLLHMAGYTTPSSLATASPNQIVSGFSTLPGVDAKQAKSYLRPARRMVMLGRIEDAEEAKRVAAKLQVWTIKELERLGVWEEGFDDLVGDEIYEKMKEFC